MNGETSTAIRDLRTLFEVGTVGRLSDGLVSQLSESCIVMGCGDGQPGAGVGLVVFWP